ncbi:MAG: hypothetical protein ABSF70_10380 [Terracidiphilus sp.]
MMISTSLLKVMLTCSKRPALRHLAALLLFSGSVLTTAIAQTAFPRDAVSIPAFGSGESLDSSLKAANQCGENSLIVLPKVIFQFGAESDSVHQFAEETQALKNLPANSQVWLHVGVAPNAMTGKETEKQLTDQVDGFLKQAPLSAPIVRGVIIEPGSPRTAPDLFVFALLRLAVGAKSGNPALRLAFVFPAGFIGQYGDTAKRLALYADLLGTTDAQGWRSDAAWIAEHALNKPLILKLESGPDSTASYLNAALAASGSTVEILWSTPPDAAAANRL